MQILTFKYSFIYEASAPVEATILAKIKSLHRPRPLLKKLPMFLRGRSLANKLN